jgi:hypothetical protein
MQRLLLLSVLAPLFAGVAFAQESTPAPVATAPVAPVVIHPAVTLVDFDDLSVNASGEKPSMSLVTEVSRPGFNPLIHLRGDFADEMQAEAGWVR